MRVRRHAAQGRVDVSGKPRLVGDHERADQFLVFRLAPVRRRRVPETSLRQDFPVRIQAPLERRSARLRRAPVQNQPSPRLLPLSLNRRRRGGHIGTRPRGQVPLVMGEEHRVPRIVDHGVRATHRGLARGVAGICWRDQAECIQALVVVQNADVLVRLKG